MAGNPIAPSEPVNNTEVESVTVGLELVLFRPNKIQIAMLKTAISNTPITIISELMDRNSLSVFSIILLPQN
jgi:hypothetical protein